MIYKVGQELHHLYAEVNEETGKAEFTWWLYVVRTIRKGRVYATAKNSSTWGNVSKKHGDFGWLVPTPALYTDLVCVQTASHPNGLHVTHFATRRLALLALKKSITRDREIDWYSKEDATLILKKVEQQLKAIRTRKANAKH